MGTSTEPKDDKGREKVQCSECNQYFHRVDVHAKKVHGLSVAAYREKFPGAPLFSPAALEKGKAVPPDFDEGVTTLRFGVARLCTVENGSLTGDDRAYIPIHDEKWEMGPTETINLAHLALAIQDNENTLIVGPPGCGKTTLVRELAAILGQPLRRLPFNGEMRLADLLGGKELVTGPDGQVITSWVNGPLPDAIERGHWVLGDEFDAAPPHVTFVLHSVLEEHRQLTLMGRDGGHDVQFNPRFRFIATANTLGYGDDTGLYAGTGPMNEALLDRFHTVIRVDYPQKDSEVKMLTEKTGVKREWAVHMVDVATVVREAQRNQTTMVSISPRRLLAWARKAARLNAPRQAATVTLTNKLMPDDAKYIDGVVQRYFGGVS